MTELTRGLIALKDELMPAFHRDHERRQGRRKVARTAAISLAAFAVSANEAAAASLFQWPVPFAPAPEKAKAELPPDADPYYSTPGGFDKDVDSSLSTRKEVTDPTGQPPGTVTINTRLRRLFLSLPDGRAIEYSIGERGA